MCPALRIVQGSSFNLIAFVLCVSLQEQELEVEEAAASRPGTRS